MSTTTHGPIFDDITETCIRVSFWIEDDGEYDDLAQLRKQQDGSWLFEDLSNAYYSAEDLANVALKLFELNGK